MYKYMSVWRILQYIITTTLNQAKKSINMTCELSCIYWPLWSELAPDSGDLWSWWMLSWPCQNLTPPGPHEPAPPSPHLWPPDTPPCRRPYKKTRSILIGYKQQINQTLCVTFCKSHISYCVSMIHLIGIKKLYTW